MKKTSTKKTSTTKAKKATTPKKVQDLGAKDAATVVGGRTTTPTSNISLNFSKIESQY